MNRLFLCVYREPDVYTGTNINSDRRNRHLIGPISSIHDVLKFDSKSTNTQRTIAFSSRPIKEATAWLLLSITLLRQLQCFTLALILNPHPTEHRGWDWPILSSFRGFPRSNLTWRAELILDLYMIRWIGFIAPTIAVANGDASTCSPLSKAHAAENIHSFSEDHSCLKSNCSEFDAARIHTRWPYI